MLRPLKTPGREAVARAVLGGEGEGEREELF